MNGEIQDLSANTNRFSFCHWSGPVFSCGTSHANWCFQWEEVTKSKADEFTGRKIVSHNAFVTVAWTPFKNISWLIVIQMTLQPFKRTMSKCCSFSKDRAGRTSTRVGGCWGFRPAWAGISCATVGGSRSGETTGCHLWVLWAVLLQRSGCGARVGGRVLHPWWCQKAHSLSLGYGGVIRHSCPNLISYT